MVTGQCNPTGGAEEEKGPSSQSKCCHRLGGNHGNKMPSLSPRLTELHKYAVTPFLLISTVCVSTTCLPLVVAMVMEAHVSVGL